MKHPHTLSVLFAALLAMALIAPGSAVADDVGDASGDVYKAAEHADDSEAPEASGSYEAPSSGESLGTRIGAGTLDILVLRPLGAISSAIGFCAFVATSPFVLPSMDFRTSWEVFVLAPGEYTFVRPLGDF